MLLAYPSRRRRNRGRALAGAGVAPSPANNTAMADYTIPEVAERLGVPARDIREWIENGRLHAELVRGRWRVPEETLRSPSDEPGDHSDEAPEVAELRLRIAGLESRLEQLEQEEPAAPPLTMRPALAPLFRDGSRRADR
jgi:excisionase family DNA binding protein